MARPRLNDNAGSHPNIAGADPGETQGSATLAEGATHEEIAPEEPPVVENIPVEKKDGPVKVPILTQEDAATWFVQEGYAPPAGIPFAVVTQDGNVFWPENQSAAQNHAFRNNLKLFRLDGFK